MSAFRIVINNKTANPALVDMIRKAYHRASGNKGFANPDVVVK